PPVTFGCAPGHAISNPQPRKCTTLTINQEVISDEESDCFCRQLRTVCAIGVWARFEAENKDCYRTRGNCNRNDRYHSGGGLGGKLPAGENSRCPGGSRKKKGPLRS